MSEHTRTAVRAAGVPLRRLRVRVVQGQDTGKTIEPEGSTITVGSAADNDLVLGDATVSRYHVELCPTADGIEVTDLDSHNGTFVSTLRLTCGVVPSGADLRLGNTVLRLEEGAVVQPVSGTDPPPAIDELVGNSAAMQQVRHQVARLATAGSSTLILGETGTGKEVVARAMHRLGPRSDRSFEVVDCGSLPSTLIVSELFGHERGAFTSADQRHVGAFERADGGTLFLDEIGELPLALQPSLLGALERRSFRRLGGRSDISVDVRVVAATNQDLRAEVNRGRFRADLYYRLAVTRITIPPLRHRPEDVEPLARHFLREITGSLETYPLSDEAIDSLRRQRWSGNARELRNVIEAAVAMDELSFDPSGLSGPAAATPAEGAIRPYGEARAEAINRFERDYLDRLNQRFQGNASRAAREARMDRPYLLTLLRRHGLR